MKLRRDTADLLQRLAGRWQAYRTTRWKRGMQEHVVNVDVLVPDTTNPQTGKREPLRVRKVITYGFWAQLTEGQRQQKVHEVVERAAEMKRLEVN